MSEQPDTQETGGTTWDAPNQQVVRDDASAPWDEGIGGEQGQPVRRRRKPSNDDDKQAESRLPGQHAGLDELAQERGHEWSSDDLTVAEKQQELGG